MKYEKLTLTLIFIFLFFAFLLKPLLRSKDHFLIDFKVYHHTATEILKGNSNIYETAYDPKMKFKYAPIWGIFFIPFALFSFHTASLIWLAFTSLIFIFTFYLCRRLFLRYEIALHPLFYILGIIFWYGPLRKVFGLGQVDILLTCILLAAFYVSQKKQNTLSALLWALCISLKLPAAIFMLLYLWKKEFKLVFGVLLFGFGVNFLAALSFNPSDPFEVFRHWFFLLGASGQALMIDLQNQSLLTLFIRYFSNQDPFHIHILSLPRTLLLWMYALVCFSLFGFCFLNLKKIPKNVQDLYLFNALCIFMILLNPNVWRANYIALMPVILFVLSQIKQRFYLFWLLLLLNIFTHSGAWKIIGFETLHGTKHLHLLFMIWPMEALVLFFLMIRLFPI